MHRYTVRLNGASIRQMIQQLERLKKNIQLAERNITQRLADIGYDKATVRFADAEYDGTNDTDIQIEDTANGFRLSANGSAVLFIEFGTGITKGNGYPGTRPAQIAPIGTYGKGHGSRPKWYYYGNPGTNGVEQKNGAIMTRGNRPNACMFETSMELRNEVLQIVKEEMARAYA